MKRYYLEKRSMRRYKIYTSRDRHNLIKYIFFSITLFEPLFQSIRGYFRVRDNVSSLNSFINEIDIFLS